MMDADVKSAVRLAAGTIALRYAETHGVSLNEALELAVKGFQEALVPPASPPNPFAHMRRPPRHRGRISARKPSPITHLIGAKVSDSTVNNFRTQDSAITLGGVYQAQNKAPVEDVKPETDLFHGWHRII